MAVKTPSNIEYLGPKPNFTRDSFDTLEDMQDALEEGHIDEGHLSYCKETGITYKATKDTFGDLIWTDSLGDLNREIKEIIIDNEKVTSEALTDLNDRLTAVEREITDVEGEGIGENTRLDQVYEWFDIQTHLPVLSSIIRKATPGNLRRGTTHTYNAVFTWDWANREPGVTGLTVVNNGTSVVKTFEELNLNPFVLGGSYIWPITVNLGDSVVTIKSGFFNTEVQGTSQITVTPLTPTYTWSKTGLPETWETYNPTKTYTLSMTVTGRNLAATQEGDRIYKSDGTTLKIVKGITDSNVVATETKSISLTDVRQLNWYWRSGPARYFKGSYASTDNFDQAHEYALISNSNYEAFLSASDRSVYYSTLTPGDYYIYDITSNKFADQASNRLEFVDTPTSTFTLTSTGKGYTITRGGNSSSYLFYSPGRIDLWLNGNGSSKVAYWKFTNVSNKTYKIYTDESYDNGSETIVASNSEGDLRSSKTYFPYPSFFIVSSTTGDTVTGAISHALEVSKQAYLDSGPTEIPVIEFPANSTGIYLSPYDVRSLKVKSQKSGETTWTTNSSWTYKGTYTYNEITYYYIGNQGIGAGNFKFKFET